MTNTKGTMEQTLVNESTDYIKGLRNHFKSKFEIIADMSFDTYTKNLGNDITISYKRKEMLSIIKDQIERLNTMISERGMN